MLYVSIGFGSARIPLVRDQMISTLDPLVVKLLLGGPTNLATDVDVSFAITLFSKIQLENNMVLTHRILFRV